MQEFWITVSIIAAVIACVAAGLLLARLYEKRRTEQLRQTAGELSFQFLGTNDDGLSAKLAGFSLCSQGRSRKLWNLMRGSGKETTVSLFDYRYTVGSGKNSSTYNQTVACFESDGLRLPNFELRPERWYHRIGSIFGSQDIDFADFPAFSRKYLLRGESEQEVRYVFTASVVETLERLDGLYAEGRRNGLLVYRSGRRVKPFELKHFLEEGFRVYTALAEACRPKPMAEAVSTAE